MDLCVVCQATGAESHPYWRGLKRCGRCGHCTGAGSVVDSDLPSMYGSAFFFGHSHPNADAYADYLGDRSVLELQFQERLREVRAFQPTGRLVEVGCAYGFFLAAAEAHFSVRGFDLAEAPVAYAREHLGVDARCEDFLEAEIEPASVDVAALWDTIEHLPRPDLTLQRAALALRDGGYVFLTTGDIDSAFAKATRERWHLIHPTHLHYFSRTSIAELLSHAGFTTLAIRYVGTRRSLRQIAFSLLVRGNGRLSALGRLVMDSPAGDFSFGLNTRDLMLVVGRKQ